MSFYDANLRTDISYYSFGSSDHVYQLTVGYVKVKMFQEVYGVGRLHNKK